jgi:hypothetical protein
MRKLFTMIALMAMCLFVFTACEGLDFGSGKKPKYPVSGTHNGHDYVDLGLPSGLLWATCNIGAKHPEDYGYYFAWGETEPKDVYNWHTYKYAYLDTDTTFVLTKYCDFPENGKDGFVDNKYVLDPEDDAAQVIWGGGWRMPTIYEIQELMDNCSIGGFVDIAGEGEYIYGDGTQVYDPFGDGDEYMFLPFAGYKINDVLYDEDTIQVAYYWSNNLVSADRGGESVGADAWGDSWNGFYRAVGLPIRPVLDPWNVE